MKDIQKILRSFHFALKGLRHAYKGDKSFRMEINYGFPTYLIMGWLLAPFEPWELLLFVFSYLLILIVELVNTAFEKMLERVHPEEHELIGKSKDISSGAVLIALLFAVVVISVLVLLRMTESIPVLIERPFV